MKVLLIFQMLFVYTGFQDADLEVANKNYDDDNIDEDIFTKCYEGLGCVETNSKWYHKEYRPINLRPLDSYIIKTEFLLIKKNMSIPTNYLQEDDSTKGGKLFYSSLAFKDKNSNIKSSGFSKESDTIILIHDFTSNGYTGWVKHLASVIFKRNLDFNIVSVDWQKGAEPPLDQAIANARVVALEIIAFIKAVQKSSLIRIEATHIIGHGVGAHIAGYVGTNFPHLGKITGLDPTGPRFEGMPDIVKLNPSTASYVEVIHTDKFEANSQGSKETMGHSDFYINNAELQPGCVDAKNFIKLTEVERGSLKSGKILSGCSHKRAFKYFIESIQNVHCTFLGISCKNYSDFENGKCSSCGRNETYACKKFGLKSYKYSQKFQSFYLNVAEKKPYCLHTYRISVEVSSGKEHHGYFDFLLADDNSKIANVSFSGPGSRYKDFGSDKENSYIYYSKDSKLSNITEAKVRWNEKKKLYCFIYCKQAILLTRINVQVLENQIDTMEPSKGSDLCPPNLDAEELENGVYTTFYPCPNSTTEAMNITTS